LEVNFGLSATCTSNTMDETDLTLKLPISEKPVEFIAYMKVYVRLGVQKRGIHPINPFTAFHLPSPVFICVKPYEPTKYTNCFGA